MFARTPRLLLRPGWMEDAPALAAAIGEEATVRNLARVPWPYGVSDAETYLAAQQAGGDGLPSLIVVARETGGPRIVGGVGLHWSPAREVELGYWIASAFRGRGFATEAAAALLRLAHGSLRVKRIVAGHFLDNPASGRVLRKLGFRATGRLYTQYSVGRGAEVQSAGYERVAEEDRVEDPRPLAA
jgi:RimJ/RimL family protein N-acetyltransferase